MNHCRISWLNLLWLANYWLYLLLYSLLCVMCCGKLNSGLWGWQCKSSAIAKENCALRCLSPVCYQLIYESDPVRVCKKMVMMIEFSVNFCLFFFMNGLFCLLSSLKKVKKI